MPKRGVNIYKRKDGRWEGRIKKEDADYAAECVSRKYISVYGKTDRGISILLKMYLLVHQCIICDIYIW